jgi:hypothetical protein
VSSKYNIGDLVLLNDFGRLVMSNNQSRVGIVVSGPLNMLHNSYTIQEPNLSYWAYDILIGNELITQVPESFLERMIEENHEENPKDLEMFFSGSVNKSRRK